LTENPKAQNQTLYQTLANFNRTSDHNYMALCYL